MTEPAVSPTEATAADFHAAVAREQLRMLLAHTEVGIFAATAFAVLVALGLQSGAFGSVPSSFIAGWLIAKVAVVVPRLTAAWLARGLRPQFVERAGRRIVPLLALDGAVWGLGASYLMRGPPETWSLIAAFVCCVACVATFGLQVRLAATAAYVVPMIAPTAIGLLLRGGTTADIAAVGLLFLLGLLLSTSQRSERRVAELIELRFSTEKVAAERASALSLAALHSQAKDRFLAIVSHELRTPLHGIIGLTKLTRADLPRLAASTLAHYRLELIEEASLHLQRMVNDLLDISIMESGRLKFYPAPFRLLHELSIITETYSARAPELGIGFKTHIQPGLGGVVLGDSARVAQVLHNLLANAFKFTPLGGSVTLEVERLPSSSDIQFLVRDTGPGVPESEREGIFETFSQGTTAGSRPGGFGLGLAICRQLARAMGGDVVYRMTGASGSAFIFTATLPLQAEIESLAAIAPPITQPKSTYVGLTVYLADDDQLSLLVAGSVIRSLGCNLEFFVDGRQLVDRFKTADQPPDAIVLDWDMPVLDGRSAALIIRQHERALGRPPVPIIGLSANASKAYALAGADLGMSMFLTKPCAPNTLADAITAHIGREPSASWDASPDKAR